MKEIRWRKDHTQIGPNIVQHSAIIELVDLPEKDIDEIINKAKRVGAKLGMNKKGIDDPKHRGLIKEEV